MALPPAFPAVGPLRAADVHQDLLKLVAVLLPHLLQVVFRGQHEYLLFYFGNAIPELLIVGLTNVAAVPLRGFDIFPQFHN